jgi:hypothetical protein
MFLLWAEQSCGGELLRSPSIETFFFSDGENELEAKIESVDEMFKNLASSSQILDSLSSSRGKESSSTLDYYMFGALEEVMSFP